MQTSINKGSVQPLEPFRMNLPLLWKDRVIGLALRLNLILIFVFAGILIFFYWRLPPEIPLFYSRPWGGEQLASTFFLLALFALLLMMMVVNTVFSSVIFKKELLLTQIISWTSVIVGFLIVFTVLRIVLLVT